MAKPFQRTEDPILQPTLRWIPGYERYYAIDKSGIITSFVAKTPKTLRTISSNGYIACNLYVFRFQDTAHKRNNSKLKSVSNLVLQTWGSLPPTKTSLVLYKDGDKTNIHISNLEWMERAELTRRTVNKIKGTMNRRPRIRYIIVVDGQFAANSLLKGVAKNHVKQGKLINKTVKVFDVQTFEKTLLKKNQINVEALDNIFKPEKSQ